MHERMLHSTAARVNFSASMHTESTYAVSITTASSHTKQDSDAPCPAEIIVTDQEPVDQLAPAREVALESAAIDMDTFDLQHTATALMPPPAAGAPVESHMDFLQQQLDCIGVEMPILNGLLLLGSSGNQRLQGGALLYACARSCAVIFSGPKPHFDGRYYIVTSIAVVIS